ncbi:MAG TPA: hypothetical protein VIY48_17530 [Candidatus Paceibacterota bacterium]
MTDFARSLLRDLVQKALGIVFAWIGIHILAIPQDVKNAVTNWAVLTVTAVLLLIWTTIVRWLETRQGATKLDGYLRVIAKLVMFGVKGLPVYVLPKEPEPVPQEIPSANAAQQTMIIPTYTPPTPTVFPGGQPIHPE